jgi:hypothetical protein
MSEYEGMKTDTCPHRGGKHCFRVCPTCKSYRQFWRDANGVRVAFWDCSLMILASLYIEGNTMTAQLDRRLVGNQAATESLRNTMAGVDSLAGGLVAAQMALTRDVHAFPPPVVRELNAIATPKEVGYK